MFAPFVVAAALSSTTVTAPQVAPKMLIVNNLLIGTLTAQGWKNGEADVSKSVKEFKAYKLELTRCRDRAEFAGFEFSEGVYGNFIMDMPYRSGTFWSGSRPKYPRALTMMNPDSKEYRGYVEQQLLASSKKKYSYKAELTTLVRVDLDGDGTEEVLIEAQGPGGGIHDMVEPKKGVFSGVYLRHVVNGVAKTEPVLVSTIENEQIGGLLERFEVEAIADLDGDGKYEVIVSTAYYEGQGAVVYAYRQGKMIEKLVFGAGA